MKPTRADLLATVSELQALVGRAMSAYCNDRATDRAEGVQLPLREAEQLCIDALGHDRPMSRGETIRRVSRVRGRPMTSDRDGGGKP